VTAIYHARLNCLSTYLRGAFGCVPMCHLVNQANHHANQANHHAMPRIARSIALKATQAHEPILMDDQKLHRPLFRHTLKTVISQHCLSSLRVQSHPKRIAPLRAHRSPKELHNPIKRCATPQTLHRSPTYREPPPKGTLTAKIGFATFVHDPDPVAPLQLTCVPGVICALRNEYVVPCCVPLLSTVAREKRG
jgi:hypothetical protein